MTHLDSPLPFTIPSWIIVQALKILHGRKAKNDTNSRLDSMNEMPQHQLIYRALSTKQKKSSKQHSQVVSLSVRNHKLMYPKQIIETMKLIQG